MTWNKDPDKAFPARHPREPGGLRQDILDEIADHLACAAEREAERQENENEEAVWNRVLDRFGDPDAIARKLWWDQMRETVMREWIQTGVMVVVTVAVLAGLGLMMRLVAGVGTANDAMRAAMEQVAASNEALATAMAEQRAGNEALLTALSGIRGGETPPEAELSTIEIVVRRGSPEGPPAPEVKVEMRGPGPNDGSLTVDAELDAEGRAAFARLYQGAYTLSFEDPTSGLFSEKRITIFAGKGGGEHVIVAPDVMPRPVHIDWDLPEYGRDEELLLYTSLFGTWEYEDQDWSAIVRVEAGHAGTRMHGEPGQYRYQRPNRVVPSGSVFGDTSLPTCMLAGDVSLAEYLQLNYRPGPDAEWGRSSSWDLKTSRVPTDSLGRPVRRSVSSSAIELALTPVSDGQYAVELPAELLENYGYLARFNRNIERVPSEDHETWREAVSKELTDSYLVQMEVLPAVRRGEWREGMVFAATDEAEPEALPVQHIAALALPDDWRADLDSGDQGLLGVRIDASFRGVDSDNVLEAYVIRSDWRSQSWTYWSSIAQDKKGAAMELDSSPFWTISGGEISARAGNVDDFYVPVPADLGGDGSAPMTGILLRWQRPFDVSTSWSSRIEEGDKTNHSPRWIVTEPIDASKSGKPLTDIEDGRFHYDKEVFTEPLTPKSFKLQPAPDVEAPATREETTPPSPDE